HKVGYESGYMSGYVHGNSTGYENGFENGNWTGYLSGYNIGFEDGNRTGYSLGYESGFEEGTREGYSRGFSEGSTVGYTLGFSDGNQTGFNIGYVYGNLTGYTLGYEDGYLQGVIDGAGRGFTIRDPTYQEALSFIFWDQTDKNEYNPENYTCLNFAADVKNNAFKAGYRCGFVYIRFPVFAHAIVCFNTTDHGLIFIEPQTDEIVKLEIGKPYWDRTKYMVPYDDTVVSYVIIW
ncbi:MAG: hypothetical protein QXR59_01240, partial [Candidatus Bathyarchaeia archaeon]